MAEIFNSKKKVMPERIALRFKERGADPDKFVWFVNGDLDKEKTYVDMWLAFDDKYYYALTGVDRYYRISGKGKVDNYFEIKGFNRRPLSELGQLSAERMIATGRLISKKEDGAMEILALFSLGRTSSFENFAKYFNMYNVKDLDEDPPMAERELYCPKCGLRYPDVHRQICPKCSKKMSVIARLLKMFWHYKTSVSVIVGFMGINALINLVSPYISTRILYDNVLSKKQPFMIGNVRIAGFGDVMIFIILLLSMRLFTTGVSIIYSRFLNGVVPKVIYDMKMMVFKSMQRLSLSFYTSKQTGSLMNRINGDANYIYWFFCDGIPFIVVNFLTFVGVLVTMLVINLKLTLFLIVAVPIIAAMYYFLIRSFTGMYHIRWVFNARMSSLLSDALYGQRLIKAYSKEEDENARFGELSTAVKRSDTNLSVSQATWFPMFGLLMTTVQCVIMAWCGILIVSGDPDMSYGTMLLFSSYTSMLYSPLVNLQTVINWWAGCLDATQRIFEIIDAESDVVEKENPVRVERFKGAFEAKDVFFEYEPGRPVIRNLSISIKPGQMLGIVGRTGTGKSTLVNLLARLYDPKSGSIFLDGYNIKDLSVADLRRNIGIVSQDIYLFMGSIADNIRYARPDADLDDVIAAAKAASAHDFIVKMPDGYETRIGADGQGLSGGEKQRVSIARAIIQNPSVLILDEATAAMDTETERNIQNALARISEDKTVISIAHRLSTLRDADMLAVIKKGKVVEYGTHDELIRIKDGVYKKLYTLQMEALKIIGIAE